MRNYDYFLGSSAAETSFTVSYIHQLQQAIELVYWHLTELARSDRFYSVLRSSFGTNFSYQQAQALQKQWQQRRYESLPTIEILGSELGTARGAYAKSSDTIYLSEQFLAQEDFDSIASVLIEEIGHAVDAKLNRTDTAGDEGAIFAALAMQKELNQAELTKLKAENDFANIETEGQLVTVEQAEELPPDANTEADISALIEWEDSAGRTHAVRNATVKILNRSGETLGTTRTNEQGFLEKRVSGRIPGNEVSFKIYANGDSHEINPNDGSSNVFFYKSDEYSANSLLSEVIVPKASFGRIPGLGIGQYAISYSDAIFTADKFYTNFLSDILQSPRTASSTPESILLVKDIVKSVASHDGIIDTLFIGNRNAYVWDTILHEYGHFLAWQNNWRVIDHNMRNNTEHARGISSLTGGSKGSGSGRITIAAKERSSALRMAWSEGLADYTSQAIQKISKDNGWMTNVANTDDEIALVNGVEYGIEAELDTGDMPGEGEGDELTVSRILWDIADSSDSEVFRSGLRDNISYGHQRLFETFEDISYLDRLDDVWDALTANASYREKANLGAIFEEYNVAPVPDLGKRTIFVPGSSLEFGWDPGNEVIREGRSVESNDYFRAYIFNDDFSQIVYESELKRDLGWNPRENSDWDPSKIKPGKLYHFVVEGIDDKEGVNGESHAIADVTGGYWSGAREFSIGPLIGTVNVSTLKSGSQFLANARENIEQSSALKNLPVLGDFKGNQTLSFFNKLETSLTSQIGSLNNLETPERVKQAFVNGLVNAGINLFSDDVGVVEESDGSTRFDFSISDSFSLTSQSMAADLGLPGLGLSLDASSQLDLNVEYDFDFSIDIDEDGSLELQTPDSEDLKLRLRAAMPDGQLSGKLGFLQVAASDDSAMPSSVDLQLGIDVENSSVKKVTIDGSVDLNFDLKTSFAGNEALPSLLTDLDLDWDWESGGKPKIAFNNVRVDVGSFFNKFASPVLEKVQTVTQPLQPVADFLTKSVSIGGKSVSMQNLFKLSSAEGTFLDSLSDVSELVSLVNSMQKRGADQRLEINLGSFDLGSADVSNVNLDPKTIVPRVTVNAPSFSSQTSGATTKEKAFFSQLKTGAGEGFAFPILNDPNQAFNLLLGKNVDLFTYDMPKLRMDARYESPFIPIFGPLGARIEGQVDAYADINLGFDTLGLQKIAGGAAEKHFLDGFYINEDSNLGLAASLKASAELNAGIARAGAGGGVTGSLGLTLDEPSRNGKRDGKVHLDEFNSPNGSPFQKTGALKAGLHAYFKVGWGWLSYTKRFKGPETTLVQFGPRVGGVVEQTPFTPPVETELIGLSPSGTERASELVGNNFNNSIKGDGDTNFLIGGSGGDRLRGEGGFDVASYVTANRGVTVDLILPEDNSGDAYGDSYSSIEQIEGSMYGDELRGSSGNDVFDGLDGNDILEGRSGNDSFLGSRGSDTISGGSGNDSLSYSASDGAVSVNLQTNTTTGGFSQGDRISSIENLEGSTFNDSLSGDSGNNIIDGIDGDDILAGGAGDDTLTGGGGRDLFKITGGGIDTITDFESGRDRLQVSNVIYFDELSFVQNGSDTMMRLGSQTIARLEGTRASYFAEEDFDNRFLRRPSKPPIFQKPGLLDL